jgi:hypothetical protein
VRWGQRWDCGWEGLEGAGERQAWKGELAAQRPPRWERKEQEGTQRDFCHEEGLGRA